MKQNEMQNWETDLFNAYKAAQAAGRFVQWVQATPDVPEAEFLRRFLELPEQAQKSLREAVQERRAGRA